VEKGTIIVLNGVSSSGKSSLSKELTKFLPDFFAFSIDDFDLVIEKMEDRVGQRLISIETEYFYYKNVAMFSNRGVNLILDQIIHDPLTLKNFYEALKGYPVLFVGVHCPVDELLHREQSRGDRRTGLAASQLEYVHKQEIYDVEVNTFNQSLSECAKEIADRLKSTTPLIGFKKSFELVENSSFNLNK
jgi:chloramphenicol 3-O phosphotransferase